jgi:glucosyl-3-phosphoglycerate synthase
MVANREDAMSDGQCSLSRAVDGWLTGRTGTAGEWSASQLLRAKGDTRISVVLPARDEEATVGQIVRVIRHALVRRVPLLDEIIVVNSRSRDATARVARSAGATVVDQDEMVGDLPRLDGKGAAMWSGLVAATGDVVVFIDADLHDFQAAFVTGLLGPLLTDPTIGFVKGFYHRPLAGIDGVEPDGGGRVTELVARPLLNLFWPQLAGFVQPLAGEYAGRRDLLSQVPFVSGYGVETGLLIDLFELVGLDGLAQVDLGVRRHRNQSNEALGRMSAQIMLTVWSRLQSQGLIAAAVSPAPLLAQFRRDEDVPGLGRDVVVTDISVQERPPLATLRGPRTGLAAPV